MKYICTINENGYFHIFTFPNCIDHDLMYKSLIEIQTRVSMFKTTIINIELISAGFVNSKMECYGKSITLNLESREYEDTELLKSQF